MHIYFVLVLAILSSRIIELVALALIDFVRRKREYYKFLEEMAKEKVDGEQQ